MEAENVLMEGTPRGLDVREVCAAIAGVPGVRDVHHPGGRSGSEDTAPVPGVPRTASPLDQLVLV